MDKFTAKRREIAENRQEILRLQRKGFVSQAIALEKKVKIAKQSLKIMQGA